MNYNLIVQIVLICSSIGLGQMIFRKITILSSLSENVKVETEEELLTKIKKEITEKNPLKKIQYEDLLGGALKKIRILFLKTDNKIFGWTQKLKEDSQRKKIKEDSDYWDRIKEGKNK